MKFVDMHCDTLTKVLRWPEKGDLLKNTMSVDYTRLMEHERALQFFASFIYLDQFENRDPELAYDFFCKVLDFYDQQVAANKDMVMPVKTWEDVCTVMNGPTKKIGSLLTLEEGAMINGKMERLEEFFDRGVRLLTLTWNFENCLGFPNSDDPDEMKLGLKPFGVEVVERMQELGMIVDVSHLSDGGFWDIVKITKKPFVASHSDARVICGHRRNLTDDMLKALANHGGVTGLNLNPPFLDFEKGSTIDAMVRHILHIINVAGEDVMAIGSDFDGISGDLEIGSTHEFYKLTAALEANHVTGRVIDKIMHENALRVLKEVLPR